MTNRRRRRKHPKKKHRRQRLGATFKVNHWWLDKRLQETPEVIAAVDWLVFRTSDCPFRTGTYRAIRYAKAFALEKSTTPDPGFKPLTQATPAHGKPPRIYTINYRQITVKTPRKSPLWSPPVHPTTTP